MQDTINTVVNFTREIIENNNILIGIFIGSSIIILESIIPILPLALFITINMIAFGNIFGFIISWISTIIGCIISFTIVRKNLSNIFKNKYNNPKVIKTLDNISKISLPSLIIVTALPYTPAFLINIASGLSNISYKKFIITIIISKIFIVYFWGFIGTTLIESITDFDIIIEIFLLLLLIYLISKYINKKFNIN